MVIPDLELDIHPEVTGDFALMATNPALELVYWSDAAVRLLGFARDATLGRLPFEVFMRPEDFAVAASYCSQLINAPAAAVELWARFNAWTSTGERVDCDWYHQRVYRRDNGELLLLVCMAIPASAKGYQPAYQALVDQYAARFQHWADQRTQRWEDWHRLFSEHCSAVRFEHGLYAALTPRERELVDELCRSMRLKVVAQRLGISINTARNHLKSIFSKLQVHSQEQLIREVRVLNYS